MAKNWWFKFEYRVWQSDPELSQCSLAARGLWLEIICAMHSQATHTLTLSLEQLGRLARCEASEAARYALELKTANAANVTLGHGNVTLTSRRLQRGVTTRENNRLRKQKERVTEMSQDRVISKSNKKEVRKEKEEEKKAAATKLSDEEWLESLQTNPAYKLLDVRNEFARAQVWADANNRQCTRRFFVGWINRAKPMDVNRNGQAYVGKSTYIEPEYHCRRCFDSKTVVVEKSVETRLFTGDMEEVPCPECAEVVV